MNPHHHHRLPHPHRGFTLPAVLVLAASLLILTVGLLGLVGIERKTARSYSDAKRAELAARAGLEEFQAILRAQTANDDFLIISHTAAPNPISKFQPPPYTYIARGSSGSDRLSYSYTPLFSHSSSPEKTPTLKTQDPASLLGQENTTLETLPWLDPATVAWIPVKDSQGNTVGRYAYWVEDLQSRLNPKVAGNERAEDGTHARSAWPFPAPGINPNPLSPTDPRLDDIALYALEPDAGDQPTKDFTHNLIKGRPLMITPESSLAAYNLRTSLERGDDGLLPDPVASNLERFTFPTLQSYEEQPIVPFAPGISQDLVGKPKLNLNELLESESRPAAVDEFAAWIRTALPAFGERAGGFPEDYVKTLAANAFDYADQDSDPSLDPGTYRGVDSYPLLSEIILHVHSLGISVVNSRNILKFDVNLYTELWNLTNQPVTGSSQVSYEVDMRLSGVGAAAQGRPFDDPVILDDPNRSTHNLVKSDGLYWSQPFDVSLGPDQYQMYHVARVQYSIDVGPSSIDPGNAFDMSEVEGVTGMSHRWGAQQVERIPSIIRLPSGGLPTRSERQFGRAAIPAHSYGNPQIANYTNNMGDPRMSTYFRNVKLGPNAYPDNISPNRRNIRRGTIYDSDGGTKPKIYGRVLPSEWPDGGHDSPTGTWTNSTDPSIRPDDARYATNLPDPNPETAPQRLSNAGRFFSVTELGRVFDPIMWLPTYLDPSATSSIRGGNMAFKDNDPETYSWPLVRLTSEPSNVHGGGNTLRIGRQEHPRFDYPGMRASHLLDLFHTGESTSENPELRKGKTVFINGQVNLNTASEEVIRTLAAGLITQDPSIARIVNRSHQTSSLKAPPTQKLPIGSPTGELGDAAAGEIIAKAIIRSRPFSSASEIAAASLQPKPAAPGNEVDPHAAFGNLQQYSTLGQNIQWSDSAAEEIFARVFEGSTLRSRNFRVWVIGQAIAPVKPGTPPNNPVILAESRKSFTVFADPGTRKEDGSIDTSTYLPRVVHENDF